MSLFGAAEKMPHEVVLEQTNWQHGVASPCWTITPHQVVSANIRSTAAIQVNFTWIRRFRISCWQNFGHRPIPSWRWCEPCHSEIKLPKYPTTIPCWGQSSIHTYWCLVSTDRCLFCIASTIQWKSVLRTRHNYREYISGIVKNIFDPKNVSSKPIYTVFLFHKSSQPHVYGRRYSFAKTVTSHLFLEDVLSPIQQKQGQSHFSYEKLVFTSRLPPFKNNPGKIKLFLRDHG
jgi:hypothetical protein